MNAAHLHLLLNHVPLVGLLFSAIILALGLLRSNESFIRIGLLIVLISGVFAVPTFLSGEPAEKVIEQFSGFSEELVEAHEETAELTIWLVVVTTIAAGTGLWFSIRKEVLSRRVFWLVLSLNLISLFAIARTSQLGGRISHPEIRDTHSQAPAHIEGPR